MTIHQEKAGKTSEPFPGSGEMNQHMRALNLSTSAFDFPDAGWQSFRPSLDAISTLDHQGKVMDWNAAAEWLLGYSREETLGQDLAQLILPEQFRKAFYRSLASGLGTDEGPNQTHQLETSVLRKDGSELMCKVTICQVPAEGAPLFTVTVRDIAEQNPAQEASRHNEAMLMDFFENASLGLHWVGPDGMILRANRAVLQLLGYSPEEYIGHHIAEFHGDEAVVTDILSRFARQEPLVDYEARLRCKDGSMKLVQITSSVYVENHRLIHTRCFTRDVTQRNQAEQELLESELRFRNLADTAPIYMAMADETGNAVYFNKPWLQFTGRKLEELTGLGWLCTLHPEDAPKFEAAFKHAFENQLPIREEYRFLRADGEYRWMLAVGAPRLTPDGRFIGYFGTYTDITDRKHVEQTLQRNNEWFKLVSQATQDAIWDWDLLTNQITWNEGIYALFSYQRQDVDSNASWWVEHLHPEDRDRVIQGLHAVIDSGQVHWADEYKYLTGDGGFKFVYDRGFVLHDEQGKPVRMIGSMQDLTERKKAEIAIKESEARFRTIADASPNIVWTLDPDFRMTYLNKAGLSFFGTTFDEFQDNTWAAYVHPDELDSVRQTVANAIAQRAPYTLEQRLKQANGEFRWFLTSGALSVLPNGELYGLVGSCVDITDRKLAELALTKGYERERLMRRIAEIMNKTFEIDTLLDEIATEIGAFFGVARAYIVRYVQTDNYLNLSVSGQYYRDPDVPVIDVADFPPKILKALSRDLPIEQAMRTQRFNNAEDYRNDLKQRMFELPCSNDMPAEEIEDYIHLFEELLINKYCTSAILRTGIRFRGNPYGVITLQECYKDRVWTDEELEVLQDLAIQIGVSFYQTELYHLEQKAREEAEEANRKKSEFLGMMSHELRTPLNAIIGYSQMMVQGMAGALTDKQAQYADNISASGRHLLDIVNDLLDVSRVEAGKMALSIEHIAVEPLVESVRSMMGELAHKKQVMLSFHLQPQLPSIDADPARLKQIFVNLINNAIKFNCPGGEVHVWVSRSDDNQWLQCEVQDTGMGIPEDKAAQLFQKFYQINTSSSRYHEGTGLGLALTKELVELHGGSIAVESDEGRGATFFFRLPIHQPE